MTQESAPLAGLLGELLRSPLPPRVVYMRLAMAAASPAELAVAMNRAAVDAEVMPRLDALLAVATAHPQGWQMVHDVMAVADHAALATEPTARVAAVAHMFDAAAAISPVAGVALYSLGDAGALQAATAEVVAWLHRHHLIGPESRVLDLGCGAGRLLAALAPEVRSVTGVDVSGEMAAAARRDAEFPNVRVLQIGGLDLAPLRGGSFDLVVALDSMPYIVGGDGILAERLVREAARVLADGGHFAVFNYSYRGDPEADRRDIAALARRAGFTPLVLGERPFTLWDGTAYLLQRS
jgi:SAM-dependent methyltransferase